MVLCGAFSLPTNSPKTPATSKSAVTESSTVFTFQLSPGGSRGSFTPGIVESRSKESQNSKSLSSKSSEKSAKKKRRKEKREEDFRIAHNALFDAATESESIATDPLLGRVVISKETTACEEEDVPDKRQLLWHAALQYHRSRHGKQTKSRKQQLRELDEVVINSSKESYNTNIRKRGLKNIHKYLPSLSESLEQPKPFVRDSQKKRQKYCPRCSCRLTFLYSSATTRRLTEIHSGCDTPASKTKSALPPYCIGCRAYLVYESWDEVQRRLYIHNFETRVDDNGSSPEGDSCPLQDFRNGRLVVVSKLDCEETTPKISNSSSEVSSFSQSVCEDVRRELFSKESAGDGGTLGHEMSSYRRKGQVRFDSREASFEDDIERRQDCETNNDNETARNEAEDENIRDDGADSDASTIGSEDDPFVDLKTPLNEDVAKVHSEFAFGSPKTTKVNDAAGVNAKDNLSKSGVPSNDSNNQSPSQANPTLTDRPSYKVIDETITFKSPTLTAKRHLEQARLAIASTFSEEFALFQNYSVKKAAATKQIAKCLHKGYELTTVKCDRCEMPMMKRGNEETVCVSCPAIIKRVRRIVKEKREGLKTPRMSNRRDFGSDSVRGVDSDEEESVGAVSDTIQNRDDDVQASAFVNETAADLIAEKYSDKPETTNYNQMYGAAGDLGMMEEGNFGQSRQAHGQSQSVSVGYSDYWVEHSASQVSNDQQANSQSGLHFEPSLTGPQHIHHPDLRQQQPFGTNSQLQNQHAHGIQRQNLHQPAYPIHHVINSQAHQTASHPQQSFVYQHHNRQQQRSSPIVQGFHQTPCREIKQNQNSSMNEHQSMSQSSYYDQSFNANGSQLQPTSYHLNTNSIESGEASLHNSLNGESVESVTKCPRDLPPDGQIWFYNPTEFEGHPVSAAHSSHASSSSGGPMTEKPTNPLARDTGTLYDSHSMAYPMQSSVHSSSKPMQAFELDNDNTCFNDSVSNLGSLQSKISSVDQSKVSLPRTRTPLPKHGKFKEIWNECVPVSFELNSGAKRQASLLESSVDKRQIDDKEAGRSELAPSMIRPDMSPSTSTTAPHLSAEEEKFCERLKQIANSLKSTAEMFDSGDDKDNTTQQQCRSPVSCELKSILAESTRQPRSPLLYGTNERLHLLNSQTNHLTESPMRKPLEPVGIKSNNRKHPRAATSPECHGRRQEKRSAADPPGREPMENTTSHHFDRRHSSTSKMTRGSKSSSRLDPPDHCELGKGADPTPQQMVTQLKSPRTRITTSTKKIHNGIISPKISLTTTQKTLSHLRTPKSKTSSTSHINHSPTSTKSSFHLNIPSWVDEEIDTPIKPVNSFGETSMDQLMRKIDEIENDFSTIVASLPGSDGLSLKFTKSDDDISTLASKTTVDMHEEAKDIERHIEHQLASNSFESQESQDKLMAGILEQMRLVQDQIEQLDSTELDDGSERSHESTEMAELLERLARAAESLRSLQVE